MKPITTSSFVNTAESMVGLVTNALADCQAAIEVWTPQEVLLEMRERDIVIRVVSHVGEIELRQRIVGLSHRDYAGWLISQIRELMVVNIVGRGSSQIQRSLIKLGTCKWDLTISLEKPVDATLPVTPIPEPIEAPSVRHGTKGK